MGLTSMFPLQILVSWMSHFFPLIQNLLLVFLRLFLLVALMRSLSLRPRAGAPREILPLPPVILNPQILFSSS
ncbi:hypothetical protein SLEP1_g41461 [Rubroshorea leprosula]|uniref:Uncharacterized protein n=1 Tax=Rubroshorea leprosula TaxID=152421 RepID=A0AAV5L756_9ROSI|nr:hypothetical protein SLEP1_g41461 [Rubroshorea leprosula]